MNILLPTYSYYPYNFGGTEVYVAGLADFLQRQGHEVTVIAGMPPEAFTDYPVFYEDTELRAVKYHYNNIQVIGIINKNVSTEEIYTKYRNQWTDSWLNVLKRLPQQHWDIIHFNAFTSAIGFGILEAVQKYSIRVKAIASYHLPLSCMKNTLLYGNTLTDCTIEPSARECTACIINSSAKIPLALAKLFTQYTPFVTELSAPMALRLKYLVSQSIDAFKMFDESIQQWHVFSKQIHKILLLNKILPNKIVVLRHGVNDIFIENQSMATIDENRINSSLTIFLFVGRFEKQKGLHTLLKTWIELVESPIRRLEIIGEMLVADDGLNSLIKKALKRKDIVWHGRKDQNEIASIMQNSHCTIIPSEWVEIGPLVFHEAISCGSNIIASDIGGCKELADLYPGKCTLFRAGNSQSLSKAILNFKFSNIAYKAISQNENYTKVLQQYKILLQENAIVL